MQSHLPEVNGGMPMSLPVEVDSMQGSESLVDARLEGMIEKARDASALLKALSHESRLLMLCMLCKGERTVTEIEHFLGMQQAVVSQQLARLRMDRIVQTRRDGRQIYYSIVDPQLAELISVLYKMYCDPSAAPQPDLREAKA